MLISSFIKTALRFLLKKRIFSLINILGLSVGIAASLMIINYVYSELSYDDFHNEADNIYRIRNERYSQGELAEQMATACDAIAWELKPNFPEIREFTVLSDYQLEGILSYGDYNFKIKDAFFASERFFKVFSYQLLAGNPDEVLKEPNTMVISESLAKKFFGDKDPVGKTMKFGNRSYLMVTGVFKDVPENTHLKFDMLISFKTMVNTYGQWVKDSWFVDIALTYILVDAGTDADELEKKINTYVHERMGPELEKRGQNMIHYLMPLKDIHLYSDYPGEAEPNGEAKTVYFLLGIAILILIIAWVNYINLSTAQSLERAREVGMRKVAGAGRSQLTKQFLLESVFLNIISAIIALGMTEILSPGFSELTGINVASDLMYQPEFWIIFILLITLGGLVSGLYPAFVLSSFKPVTILKGAVINKSRGAKLRLALIVFQFVVSIILISGTFTIQKQVKYLQDQELGFETDQVMVVQGAVNFDSTWTERQRTFKTELLSHPGIKKICASFFVPGDEVWFTNGYIKVHDNDAKLSRTLNVIHIDHDYFDFYGFDLIAGRNFIEGNENDMLCHVVNRKGAKLLGYNDPESIIGEEVETPNWKMTKKIIGVIENFHQESPKEEYAPTVFTYFPHPRFAKKYSIKLNDKNQTETIEFIERKWNDLFPGNPFEYTFLDTHFNAQYNTEMQFGRSFGMFALLAIIIAGLGLFALSMYFALKRNKEIAIRKVNGATMKDILVLLSREYLKLFLISAVIAFPLSYFILSEWLNNYAVRINFGAWFAIYPVAIMLLIIFLSVIYQVNKSARANPAHTLKFE